MVCMPRPNSSSFSQVRSEISLMTQAAEQQYRELGDPIETGEHWQ